MSRATLNAAAARGWVLVEYRAETHVIPAGDLVPHSVVDCHCQPVEDDDEVCLVIHKTMAEL